MNAHQFDDGHDTLSHDPQTTPAAPKKPWIPPTLEQIDYTATASGFIGAGTDLAFYS